MKGMNDRLTRKPKQVTGTASDDRKQNEGKAQETKGTMKRKAAESINDAKRQADELKRIIASQ